MRATACRSRPSVRTAEHLWLSPEAAQDRANLPAPLRHKVNLALANIKLDPTPFFPGMRLPAPADSRNAGFTVDLSLAFSDIEIVYRILNGGAEVEVVRIVRVPLTYLTRP